MIHLIFIAAFMVQGADAPKEWGKREWATAIESLRQGKDWSHHYAAEEATCPVCAVKVRLAGMGAAWTTGGADLDFKTSEYVSANPYLFNLWMCPKCNYCAYQGDFEKKVDVDKVRKALGSVKTYDSYFDIPYSALLRRAEQGYALQDWSDENWAWLYLYGAWVARDSKEAEAEKEYHKKTQAKFMVVSEKGKGNSRAAAAYLVAEIYRRQGEKAKALEWLAKAEKISEEVKSENIPGWIKRLREEMDGAKSGDKAK
jgi:uncharacterized protein (DUF2225 family)